MRKTKQYRVQMSHHQGIVERAFGGRVVSWSPWRTVKGFPAQAMAEVVLERLRASGGLSRFRIVYGTKVINPQEAK